ncbi:MAG: hypothetical protein LBJ89_01645, partial [Holosporales bacterium]|nr:hypothetical protein [Holosporales bacterium]
MPNREETSAQSFKAAVSANDVNYIMLKRNDGAGYMPALSLKRVFCLFAMLDKFLGGDGFADVTSEFWKSDETTDPTLQAEYERQITSNEILDAVIDSTCP